MTKGVVSCVCVLVSCSGFAGATLDYARMEAERLFARAGVAVAVTASEKPAALRLAVSGKPAPDVPSVDGVRFDGYACAAKGGSFAVGATSEKGVLNGLYALAERLGFAFVLPGEDGERVPRRLAAVADGTWTESPRFKYRGLFCSSKYDRYPTKEWYAFLAKLRFNALRANPTGGDGIPDDVFAQQLGLRLEMGGHGMSSCLPRALFEKEPELFRMFQPEDFGGKRMKDSNFCATNPKTREIVKENFKKRLELAVRRGYHAIHGWADDLPGGGWCMCSRCRALLATDQSQLTMNLEAQAVRELGADLRVPAIAYHDTMFPSWTVRPDPLCFLLFAPRERCYAHALDDPSCALNRHYLKALEEWTSRYRGIDDSHTFEYYNDKLLFRGHTPYLPETILGDGDVYERHGIESWMSLQVGGQPLGVDWNMLAHALVAWERGLDSAALTRRIAGKVATDAEAGVWQAYLESRATAYRSAFKVCTIPSALYFDYRFMPERPSDCGGAELVRGQLFGAMQLSKANAALKASAKPADGFSKRILEMELKRSAFEEIDLRAMSVHQRALNAIADHWNGAGKEKVAAAIADFREAVRLLNGAYDVFHACAGEWEKAQYYSGFVRNWSVPEIENKIRVYSQVK